MSPKFEFTAEEYIAARKLVAEVDAMLVVSQQADSFRKSRRSTVRYQKIRNKEAAAILSISVSSLYRLRREGKLKAYKDEFGVFYLEHELSEVVKKDAENGVDFESP